jgi:hypothetical protein
MTPVTWGTLARWAIGAVVVLVIFIAWTAVAVGVEP